MVKVMEIGYNVVEFENGDSVEIWDNVLHVKKNYETIGVFAEGQWIRAAVVEETGDDE